MKDHQTKNHMLIILVLLTTDVIFAYWPLLQFLLSPNAYLKDSVVKFRGFICLRSCSRHCNWKWSALHNDEHKKDAKHKKLLLIVHSINDNSYIKLCSFNKVYPYLRMGATAISSNKTLSNYRGMFCTVINGLTHKWKQSIQCRRSPNNPCYTCNTTCIIRFLGYCKSGTSWMSNLLG